MRRLARRPGFRRFDDRATDGLIRFLIGIVQAALEFKPQSLHFVIAGIRRHDQWLNVVNI